MGERAPPAEPRSAQNGPGAPRIPGGATKSQRLQKGNEIASFSTEVVIVPISPLSL